MSSPKPPFGSWPSPIDAGALARGGVSFSELGIVYGDAFWLESRPEEAGRNVLMSCPMRGGAARERAAEGRNVRNRVHEYGGGSWTAHASQLFYTHDGDQRIYRLDPDGSEIPITPDSPDDESLRYADLSITPDGQALICVRERHQRSGEPVNELVWMPTGGEGPVRIMYDEDNFCSCPRISPDGRRLAWTSWNHPNMPWNGTNLWMASLWRDGGLDNIRRIAGGPGESIVQPAFDPDGVLHFVSDRTGWWNLYALRDDQPVALAPMEADFGGPQWVFGLSMYGFLDGGRIACVYIKDGQEGLGLIEHGAGRLSPLELPWTHFGRGGQLHTDGGNRMVFVAASPSSPAAIVCYDLGEDEYRVLRRSQAEDPDPAYISRPEAISFPTSEGQTAHGFFYPPTHPEYASAGSWSTSEHADAGGTEPGHPDGSHHGGASEAEPAESGTADPGDKPPLLVLCHGGPTGATSTEYQPKIQFWTTRGFAVLDVNYRGSTGYGRAYWEALAGQSGVIDVGDCVDAARFAADQGWVDGDKLAIRGGSAGGYVVLAALCFHDVFTAGTSAYGIADIEALALSTHKFESRYIEWLNGPYPEMRDLFRERSPLYRANTISAPLLLLQGAEDKVVPPDQAETMAEALDRNGLPFAYMLFEGEGHGFRKAENIVAAQEAELYFYGKVFGFTPADELPPIEIENLDAP